MILWAYIDQGRSVCKPRASGDDPYESKRIAPPMVVNPARAGMILIRARGAEGNRSKPRASGDDPAGRGFFVFFKK